MVSYDSAQISDLIGIYILDTLGWIIDHKQAGLYRDGGFIFIPDSNSFHKGLKIEISSNLKIVNFLNLTNNTFKPFSQDKQTPDININSNHSRSIIKHIPNAVNIVINKLSFNIFNENKRIYNEA